MRSTLLRKLAIGAAATGAALTFNPFTHAGAAPGDGTGPRAQFRKCVNQAQNARDRASTQFRQAIRKARELPQAQQAAAVQAAQQSFQTAIEQARTQFQSCTDAIDPGA